jgi:hypothetical protein
MGIVCYDVDKNIIYAFHHSRFRNGGVDSLTTLTAPLSPGDTTVHVANADGWNAASTASIFTGITVFGYKNSFGNAYDYYSRITAYDLYDVTGLDVDNNTITLKAPWPSDLGNPDDPNGTWPTGTRLANTYPGPAFKYSAFAGLILDETDTWYQIDNHIGGIDTSGTNANHSFPPGTAYVRLIWLPNYSNRSGGWSGFPDTGADHKVRFAGISITPEPQAHLTNVDGSVAQIHVPEPDIETGTVKLVAQGMKVRAL